MTTTDRPTALIIGEALIDIVTRDDSSVEHPGGSPMNVSFGLARLGHPARFLARIGDDARGHRIADHLRGAGVEIVDPLLPGTPTSTANAVIGSDGQASYVFDIAWDLPATTDTASASADIVHFGSLGAILEPGAGRVFEIVTAARPTATISFDPNVRAKLQGDRLTARGRAEAAVRLSDVVKASDEDVDWLYPGADAAAVARDWIALGAGLVVVTAGGDGAIAVTAGNEVRIPSFRVEVVDTIGAGDSFMAALISGLADRGLLGAGHRAALGGIDEATLTALVDRAARAAAITVSRAGAEPPTRLELDAFVG